MLEISNFQSSPQALPPNRSVRSPQDDTSPSFESVFDGKDTLPKNATLSSSEKASGETSTRTTENRQDSPRGEDIDLQPSLSATNSIATQEELDLKCAEYFRNIVYSENSSEQEVPTEELTPPITEICINNNKIQPNDSGILTGSGILLTIIPEIPSGSVDQLPAGTDQKTPVATNTITSASVSNMKHDALSIESIKLNESTINGSVNQIKKSTVLEFSEIAENAQSTHPRSAHTPPNSATNQTVSSATPFIVQQKNLDIASDQGKMPPFKNHANAISPTPNAATNTTLPTQQDGLSPLVVSIRGVTTSVSSMSDAEGQATAHPNALAPEDLELHASKAAIDLSSSGNTRGEYLNSRSEQVTAAQVNQAKTPLTPSDSGPDLMDKLPLDIQALHHADAKVDGPPTAATHSPYRTTQVHALDVIRQISEPARKGDTNSIEVVLTPEELGKVRLVISSGDKLLISVFADNNGTLELMRRNSDLLMRELRDAGFSDHALSFGSNSSSSGRGDWGEAPDKMTPGNDPLIGELKSEPSRRGSPASHRALDIRF